MCILIIHEFYHWICLKHNKRRTTNCKYNKAWFFAAFQIIMHTKYRLPLLLNVYLYVRFTTIGNGFYSKWTTNEHQQIFDFFFLFYFWKLPKSNGNASIKNKVWKLCWHMVIVAFPPFFFFIYRVRIQLWKDIRLLL